MHAMDAKVASMFDGLELLTTIVETGSFVRAGERVGLTQSGTSRAVARLEQQIGVRLFDRNARAVVLTDEGRRFYERVAPLVAQLHDAIASVAGTAVRGRLRVNVDAFFARHVLAPRLGAFLALYPQLEVEVVVRDGLGNLVTDGFDVAVRFGEPAPSALVARRLLRTRVLTCAAPAYLARAGRPRRPQDLAHHACILFRDPETSRPFAWEFHRGRRRITVDVAGRLVVNDIAAKLVMCLAGDGVAQFLELGTRELLDRGELVELFPRWPDELFPLYVFHPSRHLPPAKVRAFVDFVVASTQKP